MIGLTRFAKNIRLPNLKGSQHLFCTLVTEPTQNPTDKVGGFAKAYEKHASILDSPMPEENHSFATLLRSSKLMDLGDPSGKVVIGKIFHVVGDDLYIDFGWKFNCVCARPENRAEAYVRGARVRLQIRDLELSSRFLGSNSDLTLLEADCKLLGISSSPIQGSVSESSQN